MNYTFQIKNDRKHLILEEYPLFNTFLQAEGAFAKQIQQAIVELETTGKSYFAGNIFSIELNKNTVLLCDEIFDKENIIPTSLFIKIFEEWQKN